MIAMERDGEIKINPGNEVSIEDTDKIFYICLTEEENAKIVSRRRSRQRSVSGASRPNGGVVKTNEREEVESAFVCSKIKSFSFIDFIKFKVKFCINLIF